MAFITHRSKANSSPCLAWLRSSYFISSPRSTFQSTNFFSSRSFAAVNCSILRSRASRRRVNPCSSLIVANQSPLSTRRRKSSNSEQLDSPCLRRSNRSKQIKRTVGLDYSQCSTDRVCHRLTVLLSEMHALCDEILVDQHRHIVCNALDCHLHTHAHTPPYQHLTLTDRKGFTGVVECGPCCKQRVTSACRGWRDQVL